MLVMKASRGFAFASLIAAGMMGWACGSSSPDDEGEDAGTGGLGASGSSGAASGRGGRESVGGAGMDSAGASAVDAGEPGYGGAPVGGSAALGGEGGLVAGFGGATAGAGGSIAGSGGAAAGSGGTSAGTGGSVAGSGGAASGAGGAAAGSGGSAGSGGAGAAGAALALSTPSLTFAPVNCGGGVNPPQSFTITNTTNGALAWTGSVSSSPAFFSIAPTGGTLASGATVTVTVTPTTVAANSVAWIDVPTLNRIISIFGDPAGARTIAVKEQLFGAAFDWSPASLDFGPVAIGTSKTLLLTANYGISTNLPVLGSSSVNTFTPSSFDGLHPYSWSVKFAPTAVGLQGATLTLGTQQNIVSCTPQTITTRGIGSVVGAQGCMISGAPMGTPCGVGTVCGLPGKCVTELTLTGNAITFTTGAVFSGTVATGTDVLQNASAMQASIDWGDSTVSPGMINSTWQLVGEPSTGGSYVPLTVTGSHSYAIAGTYNGTATITDTQTGFSASSAFTASN